TARYAASDRRLRRRPGMGHAQPGVLDRRGRPDDRGPDVPGGRVDLPAPANAVRGRPLGWLLAGVGHQFTAPRAQLLLDAADPLRTPRVRPAPPEGTQYRCSGGRDAMRFVL